MKGGNTRVIEEGGEDGLAGNPWSAYPAVDLSSWKWIVSLYFLIPLTIQSVLFGVRDRVVGVLSSFLVSKLLKQAVGIAWCN